MHRLLAVCLALACASAFAETYRWVDASGRTVFSDTPPPGKIRNVVKTNDSEKPGDNLPFPVKQAAGNYPVTLYTSPSCAMECKQARDLLKARNVPFTEKVLQSREDSEELKALIGDAFVPSLKVGKQATRGFEPIAYNNLLDLAGYPKAPTPSSKPTGGPNP